MRSHEGFGLDVDRNKKGHFLGDLCLALSLWSDLFNASYGFYISAHKKANSDCSLRVQ